MPRCRLLAAGAALLLSGVSAPRVAAAGDPIMPLSQVTSGMHCTGYSVITGTAITSFDVDVIDVLSGPDASILVRVSGPAVDETGIAEGFSGSPVKCPDPADGNIPKTIGAIAQGTGDYGNKLVLVTPIQAMLGQPAVPLATGASAARIGGPQPLGVPLTVSGLSRGLARRLTAAAAQARRPIFATPATPPAPFAPQRLQPGSSLSAGYSSGDIAVGAIGTVSYLDGDRVWAFGHELENSGLRSLLLQDAYVYTVVSTNPNVGVGARTSYKLAAAGHMLGTISNDTSAAVVGRIGRSPTTIPVRIFAEDKDTGAVSTLGAQVVDETDIGTPTGRPALSFVAPLALLQGASAIVRSAPGELIGTVCMRITLRERRRPLRFCNRYASAGAISGENMVAAGGASDALRALTEIDRYQRNALHVTGFAARVKLRRELRQAFIRSVEMPRQVRRGRRVRVRLHLQVGRGRHITRSFRLRIPDSIRLGRRHLAFRGRDVDHGTPNLLGALVQTITTGDGRGSPSTDSGPRSLDALARRVRAIARYDGVTVRAGGHTARAYRDPGLRISGRGSAKVRVRR